MPRHTGLYYQQTSGLFVEAVLASGHVGIPERLGLRRRIQIKLRSWFKFVTGATFLVCGISESCDMVMPMQLRRDQFKIVRSVVQSIAVFVMNMFIRLKWTTDQIFNDRSVFKNCATILSNTFVSTVRDRSMSVLTVKNLLWISMSSPPRVMLSAPTHRIATCADQVHTAVNRTSTFSHSCILQQKASYA